MIFCNKNKKYFKDDAKIFINDTETVKVKVIFDERLTWKKHIEHVCKRSMKMIGILRKACSLIRPSSYLSLYYSLIYPYINYCNIVWAATHPSHLNRLLLIQRFLGMI